jgi:DNA repair protein RadC
LRRVGARNLSVTELLDRLIGSGGPEASAARIAERLYRHFGCSLYRIAVADVSALEAVSGVGVATAARLVSALELGRGYATDEDTLHDPIHLRSGRCVRQDAPPAA